MLHITNGDFAAASIRRAQLAGRQLPWRDVLHEGPVPAGLTHAALSIVRARFIARMHWDSLESAHRSFIERDATFLGSRNEDEVVLWFEHDLYDQLQLMQILAWYDELGRPPRLSIAQSPTYLSQLSTAEIVDAFERRKPVSDAVLRDAAAAWRAFTGPDPSELEPYAWSYSSEIPYLAPALERYFQEFPSTTNGLSRSEQQLLAALAEGPLRADAAYKRSHHDCERSIFLGDTVFASYVSRLARGRSPCVTGSEPTLVINPMRDLARFWRTELTLTTAGHRALIGCVDWVDVGGIDRWLGGVHLKSRQSDWRWNPSARRLRQLH